MAFIPPTGPLEVVFSFDTTGSMYSCLEQVRGRINDMIQRLQADIPGIRIAVIAHGDYCDSNIYVTKWVDFTTDVAELCDFVNKAERTSGGDGPECYELVLHQTRTRLTWTPFSRRVLVMIGDAEPHDTNYPANKDKIDWKFETQELAKMGVTIYPVQCGNYGHTATAFYKTLSTVTKSKHLKLDDFGNLFDVLMAVCYREGDDAAKLASYEKEVRARCGSAPLAHDINAIFSSLRDGDGDTGSEASTSSMDTGLPPVKAVSFMASPPIKPAKAKVNTGVRKTPTAGRLPLKSPLRRGKSAVTSRRYAKRTTVSDVLDVYREENLSLLKRENVTNTNFKLRNLNWSPWKLVLSPKLPDQKPKGWVKRRGCLPGYRLKTLNLKQNHQNKIDNGKSVILYEVSVQTPVGDHQRSRRNVVYTSFSKRCFDNSQWERCLLARVRGQIDRLVADGCKISMRFYKLSLRDDISNLRHDLRRYDYAWKKIRNIRTQPRTLIKADYCISASS